MFEDETLRMIEAVNAMKLALKKTYGVDEPYKLAAKPFQKKFIKASTKYDLAISFDSDAEIQPMCAMMVRAYKALEEQLIKENVSKIPVDTWICEHKESGKKVIICEKKEQTLKVIEDSDFDYLVMSAEELLNTIPLDIFEIRHNLKTSTIKNVRHEPHNQ